MTFTMTQFDVKKDVSSILNGVTNNTNAVPSVIGALKVAVKFPLIMMITNVSVWLLYSMYIMSTVDKTEWDAGNYTEAINIIMSHGGWLSLLTTLIISVVFVCMYFTISMVYVAIPKETKAASDVIETVSSGITKIAYSLWGVALTLVVVGMVFNVGILVYSIPAALFISMFAINAYIGISTLKFGLGPAIDAIKAFIKK